MYDHGDKKHPGEKSGGKAATAEAERRTGNRHSFTASADVTELSSGARFSTRTTDLGPGGCFIDTLVPFPVGAQVQVSVRKGETKFDTGGTVVYSQHGLGMGIALDALDASKREALDNWLMELTGARKAAFQEIAQSSRNGASHTRDNSTAVARLIRLMIGKGMITESEGTSILHDPVI